MLKPKDLYQIIAKVPVDAFYEPINGKIYSAMKSLLVKNMPIDLVTVTTNCGIQKRMLILITLMVY